MQRIWIECELFWHKADFDDRANAIFQKPVVYLVYIREVVDGIAMFIFVVDAHLVVQDGVETNIAKIGHLLYCPQIASVAFSQGENCAARSKHLLPEMRKGGCLRVCTNFYVFLCE